MPFPVAHGLIATTLFAATQQRVSLIGDRRVLLLSASLGVIPDADFIVQWMFNLRTWHRGPTHSFFFAVAMAGLALPFVHGVSLRRSTGIFLASLSHGPLDLFVSDSKAAAVELLWPFQNTRFRFPLIDYFVFFFNPRQGPWVDTLIYCLGVSLLELTIVAPFLFVVLLLKK